MSEKIEGKYAGRLIDCDVDRTRRIYQMAPMGASWGCRCAGCRNFEKAGPESFSKEFRHLLNSLGINPRKEAFLRHIVPVSAETSLYSGTFGFIGELKKNGDAKPPIPGSDVFEPFGDGAWASIREWEDPAGVWYNKPSLRLEFLILVDWVLNEPHPPMTDITCQV